ncbi:MAG: hypothetical protein QXH03_10395 [Candidatus Bathyarchaeia archaeon]
MRIEWNQSGAKLRGLRGRDRDIEELTFHGAKGKNFVVRAKLKGLKSGNRVVEEAGEIYAERKNGRVEKVAERKMDQSSLQVSKK